MNMTVLRAKISVFALFCRKKVKKTRRKCNRISNENTMRIRYNLSYDKQYSMILSELRWDKTR